MRSEDEARALLEELRWPMGPVCPRCHHTGPGAIYRITPNPGARVRAGLLECAACRKQFTVTVGTFFADLHLPLAAWLEAWRLATRPQGVGPRELQMAAGLPHYQTARGMLARLRGIASLPIEGRRGRLRVLADLDTALRCALGLRPATPLPAQQHLPRAA
jgi:hypothetical protein